MGYKKTGTSAKGKGTGTSRGQEMKYDIKGFNNFSLCAKVSSPNKLRMNHEFMAYEIVGIH